MLKWLKRLLLALLILGGFALAVYVFRAPLLRTAAAWWIVNDPLSRADVIVVLGGGPETRPFEAAKLLRQGLAPKILLMNPAAPEAWKQGVAFAEPNLDRAMLLRKAVPDSNIVMVAQIVSSTDEESLAVRDWAQTNQIRKLILVTDIFHTRRARWLFCQRLNPLGIQVQVDAVPVREYAASDWWRHELGQQAFQSEVLKYAYYRLRY